MKMKSYMVVLVSADLEKLVKCLKYRGTCLQCSDVNIRDRRMCAHFYVLVLSEKKVRHDSQDSST